MITDLYNHLADDATLLGYLTGGLHDAQMAHEISRQNTPSAYDEFKELKPCGLVRLETATPWGPNRESGRVYVIIYLYQRFGYAAIESARKRIYELLHRQQITPGDGSGLYEIQHANDLLGLEDQSLGAAMISSRYVIWVQRRR